jgi:hypothetical protein
VPSIGIAHQYVFNYALPGRHQGRLTRSVIRAAHGQARQPCAGQIAVRPGMTAPARSRPAKPILAGRFILP